MSRGTTAEKAAQKDTRPRPASCLRDPVSRATW